MFVLVSAKYLALVLILGIVDCKPVAFCCHGSEYEDFEHG